MGAITQSHNYSKCSERLTMGFIVPTDICKIQPLYLRLREHHRGREEFYKRQRTRMFVRYFPKVRATLHK